MANIKRHTRQQTKPANFNTIQIHDLLHNLDYTCKNEKDEKPMIPENISGIYQTVNRLKGIK